MLSRNSTHLSDFEDRLRRLQTIARVMDTALIVPGTNIRVGADALLGLIPGVGDLIGTAIGLAIVNEARQLGVPRRLMMRMIANIGLDVVVGSVPLVGDVFDVYFKSNRRNARLVLEHFDRKSPD